MSTAEQMLQANRCMYLANYYTFLMSLGSPFDPYGSLATYLPPVVTVLGSVQAALIAGTQDATIAQLYIRCYIHVFSAVCGYFYPDQFYADLVYFTSASGGGSTIWNGIT